jgi:hypothetical protein
MQPSAVSGWHLERALIPYYAKQIPGTAVQRAAAVALAEVTVDCRAQIWIDIAIDEIRQLAAD